MSEPAVEPPGTRGSSVALLKEVSELVRVAVSFVASFSRTKVAVMFPTRRVAVIGPVLVALPVVLVRRLAVVEVPLPHGVGVTVASVGDSVRPLPDRPRVGDTVVVLMQGPGVAVTSSSVPVLVVPFPKKVLVLSCPEESDPVVVLCAEPGRVVVLSSVGGPVELPFDELFGTSAASTGPKVFQIRSAALTASSSVLKPPSLYVAPPIESNIVLLYFS